MHKKKPLVILLVAALFLLAGGLISFVLHDKHSSSLNFQAYAPQVLPSGLRVTERTVDVWSNKTNPLTSKKILTYELDDSKGYISQANKSDYTPRAVMCEQNVLNQTCKILKTPQGQQYKVELTFTDGQELSHQTIRWFKDNTYIWMLLNTAATALSENELSQTVDSFSPVSYDNLKTKHYNPGP